MFWPSGLIVGHSTRMTLLRIASICGSPCAETQLVGELDGVLASGDFVGMESPVDVDDDLGGAGELARLSVSEAARVGQLAGDRFVFVKTGEIFGRGNDGDLEFFAAGRLAHFEHLDAVRAGGQRVEVADGVVVVGEVEVVAGVVAENGYRCRNLRTSCYEWQAQEQDREQYGNGTATNEAKMHSFP